MFQFKDAFNYSVRHDIEIVADNARTHTAQVMNIHNFCLRSGGGGGIIQNNLLDQLKNISKNIFFSTKMSIIFGNLFITFHVEDIVKNLFLLKKPAKSLKPS
jgi:hypothetical protein